MQKKVLRKKGRETGKNVPESQVVVHEYPTFIDWVKTVATNITNNWFIILLAILAVFVSFFFYYPSMGGDQDIWFHVRYGSHFVKNLTWNIDHGQFNWTEFNPKFVYVTWIGSSILYIFYSLMSHYGLYLLQYIVIGSIIFCFIYFLKRTGYRFDITSLLAILGVLMVINLKYLYIKPDMFSGLLFVVACMIYYKAKEAENWKLFYIYPLLFLIWVNMHGGFIVGLFFLNAAFGGELVNSLFFKKARFKWKTLMHFAISVILSYAVLGINPEGYGYFIGIVRDFFSPEMKDTKGIIAEYGSMWGAILFKPAGVRFRFAGYAMLLMLIVFAAICIYLLVRKRFFDMPSVFLVVFFYVFGMSVVRASQYFPLIWFFAFFYVYRRYDVIKIKGVFNFISLVVIFIMCVKIVHFALVDYDSIAWFGNNWEESYPVKEVEYIKKAKPRGNIWNDYLSGGYLLWSLYPDYKVFIDPRYGGYMRNFIRTAEESKDPKKGVESYTKRFPFKVALVAYHEGEVIEWLLKADWRIAFLDKNALVIIHKSIIPELSKEALAEDVSINRFAKVDNPAILKTLFNFYVNLDPSFGREVLQVYQENVRTIYRQRGADIMQMQNVIAQKEAQLKKITKKAKQ
ncbi:MAG: hypothetical protein HY754_08735 [Nitrospirae bacterium]|nr:hypothetical protein [Nitrospirota bacterium]